MRSNNTKNWKKVKISRIGRVITGKTPPTKKKEYFGEDFPFITPSDIKSFDKRYIFKTRRSLSQEGFNYQKQLIIPPNSVCFVCIGSTVGKICMTSELSFTNQQINTIIPDNNIVDSKFLYYRLRYDSPWIKRIAEGRGSGKPIINKTDFENLELLIPPLQEQKEISSFLSPYDNLIENFNKQLKILEKVARLTFKEWFVHYRYPGFMENSKIKTEFGLVPENWKIKRFTDCIEINPRIDVSNSIDKPYVSMSSISKKYMYFEFEEYRNKGTKFQNHDTLFARITPSCEHGKTAYVQGIEKDGVGLGSSEFFVFRSKSLSPEMVYFFAREPRLRNHAIKSMTGASGRQRVNRDCFKDLFLVEPPDSLIQKFNSIVRPFFEKIPILVKKRRNLSNFRDSIIPKILSGDININKR